MIKRIISGGQTGVDRAALDAAIELNIPHGGWCPKGRLAELGTTIPEKYILKETDSPSFGKRTRLNIRDSDGTLVLVPSIPIPQEITDGTLLTIKEVQQKKKPHLMIDLSGTLNIDAIINWVKKNDIRILNIAGPRESQSPGIYLQSLEFLKRALPLLLELQCTHLFKAIEIK